MKQFIARFNKLYIFNDALSLEARIFNLVMIFGIFAGCAAMIARIVEKVSFIAVGAVFATSVIIYIAFVISNKFNLHKYAIFAAIIIICDLLFPLIYFSNGGISSGMGGYFILGIFLHLLLLKGKTCAVMLVINVIIVLGSYIAEKLFPGLVTPFSADFQIYADHIQTVLVSGMFIGLVVKYQTRIIELERKKAVSATQAKANFLANISHEIRTPLNAIMGLGELELSKNHDTETLSNLGKMNDSGKILLTIINDLLDISKIESGRFEIIPVDYQITSLINDTVNMNIVRIRNKPVEFHLKVDENLPMMLFGDELRIRQILNNLLSNAFKYTRRGDVWLSVSGKPIDARGGRQRMLLEAAIKDTGIGIQKENIGKLFSIYSQLDAKSNRLIEGTGLGLSITRNMVEMMNGSVSVESEYGQGSTFTVSIPQQIVDPAVLGRTAAESLERFRFYEMSRERRQRTHIQMPYIHVLVVDDVPTNLDVARGMLMSYGITVDCVPSGLEAIELIRARAVLYDAIFMDHMMPQMDGIETVNVIRNELDSDYAKNIPIIALTANAIIGNEQLFLENGFQDVLTKPIDMTKLDNILQKWLRNPQKEAELGLGKNTGEDEKTNDGEGEFSMFAIDGLNYKEGLERFGNRKESYHRVLVSYAAGLPALLEKLNCVNAEDLADYRITIHGIKGASYGVSANALGKKAEALEMAAKNNELETVRAGNDPFIDDANEFLSALNNALSP
ncbi:MAG: response regulator [Treponema sp.]|jgi:signal transduction histidine kinase/AmiR/NasT family two-component response regulator/HPt (histidine-containing phosphotransfer) domain-containing protein|nr:response regulator [Treponema sp.]